MRDFSQNHDWLSINTATVRKQSGAEVPLDRIIDQCAERGIRAISPWRDQVAAVGLDKVAKQLKAHGIGLSGYCRGGFFPAADAAGLKAALDDNRRAIDEAKTLDAPCLVLVVGALPGALDGKPAYKDIGRARGEVRDGIAASLEYAREVGMPLAIEPLHPMQAADAPASTRSNMRSTSATNSTRARPACSAWRWTSITSGGTRSCSSRSPAPAVRDCWPTTSATGSRPRATCSPTAG
jgi:sugar phosphate isomerase/epimerase